MTKPLLLAIGVVIAATLLNGGLYDTKVIAVPASTLGIGTESIFRTNKLTGEVCQRYSFSDEWECH